MNASTPVLPPNVDPAGEVYQQILRQDSQLTRHARKAAYEQVWPRCEQFISACLAAAPQLEPSQRRMVRAILQYWSTYRYRNTGVYKFPTI